MKPSWIWLAILFTGACIYLGLYAGVRHVAGSECEWQGNDLEYIRCCESRDNYDIIDTTGTWYGAYQFDLPTWYSMGGVGLPNEATQAEQDYRASILYEQRGRQPWRKCFD